MNKRITDSSYINKYK